MFLQRYAFVLTLPAKKSSMQDVQSPDSFNPNRSLDIGEIAARNRMRTEAGKMPESLISPIRNGHGVSNDRFGFKEHVADQTQTLD